jgi:hypothetical protein
VLRLCALATSYYQYPGEVTETLILGMNPLDEAASMEIGAIVLKLLSDFGLI